MIYENKISYRQQKRMIYAEGFGAASLSLPAAACVGGKSGGFLPFLYYGIFLGLFSFYLFYLIGQIKNRRLKGELSMDKTYVDLLPKWVGIVYILRFIFHGFALLFFFGRSVQEIYMPKTSLFKILVPFVFLLWYCMQTTLQKRGRFLELLFPWILCTFVFMLILAVFGIWSQGDLSAANVSELFYNRATFLEEVQGAYLLLLCASPLELFLFYAAAAKKTIWKEETEETESKKDGQKPLWKHAAARGIFGFFLWNVLLWLITVLMIGFDLAGSNLWPVMKMMQLLHLPGNFPSRIDIVLVLFWILCMTGVLSGYLFYAKWIWDSIFLSGQPKEKTSRISAIVSAVLLAGLLFAVCAASGRERNLWELFWMYKKWVDFPLGLLLPFCSLGYSRKRKSKKLAGASLIVLLLIVLTGCQKMEDVEEKSYILSMYVDYNGKEYQYWPAKADLAAMEEKEEEIPCRTISISAGNLEEMERKFVKEEPGEMEWNHIYTIFLGENILKSPKALYAFLQQWDASWQKSPGVLLCVCTEEAKSLYEAKEITEGAAGQVASLLFEQEKDREFVSPVNFCQTPMDVLRREGRGETEWSFCQIRVREGKLFLMIP